MALTIGPGVTLRGQYATIGLGSGGAFTNLGTIRAEGPGGEFMINGQPIMVNLGTLECLNGGSLRLVNLVDAAGVRFSGSGTLGLEGNWGNTGNLIVNDASLLRLSGNWTNSGSINFTNTTLNLEGTHRMSDLGALNRSNATINFRGTLEGDGGPVQFNETTGSWVMKSATPA